MSIDVGVPYMNATHQGLPPLVFAHGFSFRKRFILRRFLGDRKVRFISRGRHLPPGSTLLLWGSNAAPAGLAPTVRIVRLEDGFLRSVGLGADLIRPLSWVVDGLGIYYDPARPSDLEHILQTAKFSSGLIKRASRLRCRIVKNEITKYNVGAAKWERPTGAKRVILVPGQVETDASVRLGTLDTNTNIGLLKAVRRANHDAYLLYKPHPDVTAGLRAKGPGESEANSWCDEVITDASMGQLLSAVDEVHVLTSLTGFEALLRGKRVVCYGQPFYAGWELTTDMLHVARRTRRLELDELVAGTLILYPVYISCVNGLYSSPEQIVDELLAWQRKYCRSPHSWRRRILRRILCLSARWKEARCHEGICR